MNRAEGTLCVRVVKKTREATDVCSLELQPVDGRPLPAFTAGSHIEVHLGDRLMRPYSLCNNPAENHRYLIAVLRDAHTRGGSLAMHALQVGDTLHISAPKNHFALAPSALRSLLLAGGIGVTPILCMAERLAALGADFQMHYSTRSKDRTAFFQRIQQAPFLSQVQFHFDDGEAAQKLQLGTLLSAAHTQQDGTHLYVCGPKGYIDAVLAAARSAGWPEDRLHFEFFTAEPAKSAADGRFEVKLARSGQVVLVAPDQTIVQALAAAGVTVPTSCEQGVCGTCLTGVLAGVPDHRDLFLTPAEQATNAQLLPCCSRSRTPTLVLDL